MGLFSKLFGSKSEPASEPEAAPESDPIPDAVIILRRGMSVPKSEYLEQVLAAAFPAGLPATVPRVALSQPSWFKSEEIAENIAAGVVETFAPKFSLGAATSRRRALAGPDGCELLLVELYRG